MDDIEQYKKGYRDGFQEGYKQKVKEAKYYKDVLNNEKNLEEENRNDWIHLVATIVILMSVCLFIWVFL